MPSPNDSEETPLLHARQHEEVYKRFSPARKRVILSTVSLIGLMPLLLASSFVPLIPQIGADLHTTAAMISLSISVAIFGTSIGSLLGSSYSTFYGRRPVYLIGIPISSIASLGVATSSSITQLLIWRFLQASGASVGITIGAAVIGDMYKLEERGTAMGVFFACILIGPAIGPLIGGLTAFYSSWRVMQVVVGTFGFVGSLWMLFFFPETYHPGQRGVDKIDPLALPVWRPIILNPFRPLLMLRSPNLLFISLAAFSALLTEYVLLTPIAYTIGERYGIKSEILIGACILPAALGSMVGAPLGGRLSDRTVVQWKEKRGGRWYPEDRLRAAIPGALFATPLAVLACGIFTQFVPGKTGLVLNLVCLFISGVGVDVVLSPCAAYFVDTMHHRSAEAMAAYSGFRQLLTSIVMTAIFPMIERYGVAYTNAASALIAWCGFFLIWLTIRYGDRLRAVADVGFSTSENN